jgi:hypothetical protein
VAELTVIDLLLHTCMRRYIHTLCRPDSVFYCKEAELTVIDVADEADLERVLESHGVDLAPYRWANAITMLCVPSCTLYQSRMPLWM